MAVTVRACVMLTVHVPVPLQSPFQPVKVDPVAGMGVSVTLMPWSKGTVWVAHVGPQLIPAGLLVTVPLPLPALVRVREAGEGTGAVAPVVRGGRVTVQEPGVGQ